LRSHLLKHQLNQLPSNNRHVRATPSVRGCFGEAPLVRPHVGPTAQHRANSNGPNFHSTTFGPHFHSTTHVGSTPPVGYMLLLHLWEHMLLTT